MPEHEIRSPELAYQEEPSGSGLWSLLREYSNPIRKKFSREARNENLLIFLLYHQQNECKTINLDSIVTFGMTL